MDGLNGQQLENDTSSTSSSSTVSDTIRNDNNTSAPPPSSTTTYYLDPVTGITYTHQTHLNPDTGTTIIKSTFTGADGTTAISIIPGSNRPTCQAKPGPSSDAMSENFRRMVEKRAKAAGVFRPHNPAQVAAATEYGMKVYYT